MVLNLPIFLTFLRLLLTPFFIIAFYLPFSFSATLATMLFSCAALTDFLDGFLARRLHQTTSFGAFLDPIADKIMVAAALLLLVEHYNSGWVTIPAITLIAREFTVMALRTWMTELGKSEELKVSQLGKIKTFAQMSAVISLLCQMHVWITYFGMIMLYCSMLLALFSMYAYLRILLRESK